MVAIWIARIIGGWIGFSFGTLAGLVMTCTVAALKQRKKRSTSAEAYMCAVDFNYELGYTTNSTYDSIESAIKRRKCVTDCGMVRVNVSEVEYYSPSHVEDVYWQMVRNGEIEADESVAAPENATDEVNVSVTVDTAAPAIVEVSAS